MFTVCQTHISPNRANSNYNSFDHTECKRLVIATYIKILIERNKEMASGILGGSFTLLNLLLLTGFHVTGIVCLWKCMNFLNNN